MSRRRRDQRGRIEQEVAIDGHLFSLEPSTARRNGALLSTGLLLAVTVAWTLLLDNNHNSTFLVFGIIGVWAGVPLRYQLTVQERGLRVGVARSWSGRLTKLLERDPVNARLRKRYAATDGDVVIPWEAIDSVTSGRRGRHGRILVLAIGEERLELRCAVRGSHLERFTELQSLLGERSAEARPAAIPAEIQRLRGRLRSASERS